MKVVTLDRDAVLTPRHDGSVLVEFVKGRGGEVLTDDQRKMVTTILGGFRFNQDKLIWEHYLMPTQMAKVRQVLGDLFPISMPEWW